MPEFVSVLQDPKSETVVTVSKGHAESAGLDVLDQPAVDRRGRPLGPRALETAPSDLKGKELEAAVKTANEAGAEIPASASADEKRQLLAAHQANAGQKTEETQ